MNKAQRKRAENNPAQNAFAFARNRANRPTFGRCYACGCLQFTNCDVACPHCLKESRERLHIRTEGDFDVIGRVQTVLDKHFSSPARRVPKRTAQPRGAGCFVRLDRRCGM